MTRIADKLITLGIVWMMVLVVFAGLPMIIKANGTVDIEITKVEDMTGQTEYVRGDNLTVRVTLENGDADVYITELELKITASGYSVTITPSLPAFVSANATYTHDFNVDIGSAADLGMITIDAKAKGNDADTSTTFELTGATVKETIKVVRYYAHNIDKNLNYTTIQAAVDDADAGDTIEVDPGTYDENIVINKSLTLVGDDKDTTILSGTSGNCIHITSDSVEISEFTITKFDHAVYIDGADECKISDMKLYQNMFYGLFLRDSDKTVVENNNVSNNAHGVYAMYANESIIRNNIFYNSNGAGIGILHSSLNTIEDNSIEGSSSSNIIFTNSHYCSILNNDCLKSDYDNGILLTISHYNTISGNNASQNSGGSGIRFSNSENNTVSSNVLYSNNYGILTYDSDTNTYRRNVISNNINGIYIKSSANNLIYHNNIISNTNQANCDGEDDWNNDYPTGGNYWSDYSGVDLYSGPNQDITGSDGFGDTNYTIPGGSCVDYYPLMSAFSMSFWADKPVYNVDKDRYYYTIQSGIDDADTGDTLECDNVYYYENVLVNKTVILEGEDRDSTIIYGDWSDDTVAITADHVEVSGFTVINSGNSSLDSGIKLQGADHCAITDNILMDNNNGILLLDSYFNTIEDNEIKSNSGDELLTTEPVSYWPFDEGAGTTGYDAVGGNDAVLNGTDWGEGVVGSGLLFDNDDDYASCGNDSSLDITEELTVSAWVKAKPGFIPKVAVEQRASISEADGGADDVVKQLNDDTYFDFEAKQVGGIDLNSKAELENYDVVVLGDSGQNNDDHYVFSSYLKDWVYNGGSVVSTAWVVYATSTSTYDKYLDLCIPVDASGAYGYFRSDSHNTKISFSSTSHPITDGVSDFSVKFLEYPAGGADSGTTTIGTCNSKPIVVAGTYGQGRIVYLGLTYMARDSYNDANMRTGHADKLLEQAVVWAARKEILPENDGNIITKSFAGMQGNVPNVAVEQRAGLSDADGGADEVTAQLNDDTYFDFSAEQVVGADLNSKAELEGYDVVVIGDTGQNNDDHSVFSSYLKDWVYNGGGVVSTGWVVYATSTSTYDQYLDLCIPVKASGSYGYYRYDQHSTTVTITNTTHPVTKDVSNFTVRFTEYPASGVDTGTETIATMNGKPQVVVGTYGEGRIVYLGPTYMGRDSYNVGTLSTGNADRLLEQAVAWAAKITGNSDVPYGLQMMEGEEFYFLENNTKHTDSFEGDLEDDEWHHVAVTYNGSAFSLYQDGEFKSSYYNEGPLASTEGDVIIGKFYTQGSIDEVAIWNKTLTEQEIALQYHYKKPYGTYPTGGNGIQILDSGNNTIENNEVTDNDIGIGIYGSSGNSITSNLVEQNENGISVRYSSNNVMDDNDVTENTCGIQLISSVDNVVENNDITENTKGICLTDSKNNDIHDNDINTNERGISVESADGNSIYANDISSNEYGLYIVSSEENNVYINSISTNDNGFYLNASADNNIYHNDIIDNTAQASDDGTNNWDNGAGEGNYWSDYTGVDDGSGGRTAGDNVGDTLIPHLGLDNYPLIYRWEVPRADADGPYVTYIGLSFEFDASDSYDRANEMLYYRWDLDNDGTWDTAYSTDPGYEHTYTTDYTGEVKLEVYDGTYTDTDTASVTISAMKNTIFTQWDAYVKEVNVTGDIVWQKLGLGNPQDVERLWTGNTLITEANNKRVIEVNETGSTVWSKTGLYGPYDAERLDNGNTLIADLTSVIEVNSLGTTVWSKTGYMSAVDVERLADGHTLVTDASMGKVMELNESGSIVWQLTGFTNPHDAERLTNGNTLITLINDHKVIEVNESGTVLWEYDDLTAPYDAERLQNGNTLIADYTGGCIKEVDVNGILVWQYNVTRPSDAERVGDINQPPAADCGRPYSGIEGTPITFDASASSDPDNDTLEYRWDFNDDGTWDTSFSSSPTYAYAYPDDYTGMVKVQVSDGFATDTATANVTVTNAAPSIASISDASIDEGDTYTGTGSFTDPGSGDTWTATVNYGDGSGTSTLSLNSDKSFSLTHTYSDSGSYNVVITVKDDDGGSDDISFTVNVANVAPGVNAGPDATINEGDTFTQTGSFTDPGADSWTATVDYGAGSGTQSLALSGKSFSLSHKYTDNGVYTVTVTVKDDDGGEASDTIQVTVLNVAPTVDAGPDATVSEGSTYTSSGAFADPGADTWTATVDYGDGSGTQTLALNSDKSFSLSHTYSDNGVYTVTVTVTDDDSGSGSDTAMVTVNNVGPTVDAGPDGTVNEGDTFTSSGSFADPGSDTWSATVNYGDGSGVQTLALNTDKTFSLSHTYSDNGVYTVTVTVSDDDSGSGSDTAMVTVNNVAPTVDAGADATIDEGGTFTSSGSFADPGSDTWTATVDYGDGSGTQALALSGKTFSLSHKFNDNGMYTVTVKVTDDDGGTGSDSVTVTVNNIVPTVDAGADATIDEGSTFISSGSFTDPGSDTWTATVDYGDGSGTQALALSGKTFSLSHTYTDNGVYTVTINVKDDDSGTGSDTVTVTVNNVAPLVNAGADATINEGSTFTGTGSFTDPGADTWSATVNYGDGSGTQTLALSGKAFGLSHTYADNGVFTVTVTVKDDDSGEGDDTLTVTVNNVAPVVSAGPDTTINEGDTYIGSGSFADPGADTWTATVDYGDGTGTQTLTLNSDKTFSLSHTYTDNGVYTVTVTVTDDDSGTGSDTLKVTVNNVAPTVGAGPDVTINEGGTFTGSGSFTDPGADTWTATVDYGDGSGTQTLTLSGKAFSLSHTYADNGVYTVTVTVTDDDNGAGSDTLQVTVNNVAPSVNAGADATIDEGSTFTGTGSFIDPGADTWIATVDYGDGSGTQALALSGKAFSLSHTYIDNGIYTVTVTVKDDDGGVGDDTLTVTVNNVAPTVNAGADATIDEGSTYTGTGSFTDPGADTWTATVDYGDGSGTQTLALSGKSFVLGHTYLDNGVYTVTVTVKDDDGGEGDDTVVVTVNNVAPLVDAGADTTINEGDTFVQSGSFTDPGADTWTATVNYGDGSGTQTLALSGKSFTLSHTYADNGVYTVTVVVKDDDGGSDADIVKVTVLNVDPKVYAGADTVINEGDTLTRNGYFTDPGADTWTATVNYGDGTGTQTLALNSDKTFSLSHTYADNGAYTVTVTVTDDDSGVGSYTFLVTVLNVAPSVYAGADAAVDEGEAFFASGYFTDPGADTWTAVVNFGDGTPMQTVILNSDKTFDITHAYGDNGVYTVYVTVQDDDGGFGTDSLTVTVSNVAPTVSIDSIDQPYETFIMPGDVLTFHGSFIDPGWLDTHYIEWDFDDGTIITDTLDPSHTFTTSGQYTVTLTVTDDDGGSDSDSVQLLIFNAAEATKALIEKIKAMGLHHGIENSLVSKLENAIPKMENDQNATARNKLEAFIKEVKAQSGKKIPVDDAEFMIKAATWIIDNMQY